MQTKGQYLVGTTFNPSSSGKVDRIKALAAELIDEIEWIELNTADGDEVQNREIMRCRATAITNVEQGAMWAVKAATKKPKE